AYIFTTDVVGIHQVAVDVSNPLCGTTRYYEVEVFENPIVEVGSDLSICEGDAVVLDATGNGTITWSNGVIDGSSFVPEGNDILVATIIDEHECTSTDEFVLTVNPLPGIEV